MSSLEVCELGRDRSRNFDTACVFILSGCFFTAVGLVRFAAGAGARFFWLPVRGAVFRC